MTRTHPAVWAMAVGMVVAALLLTGCSDDVADKVAYQPAELEEIEDSDVLRLTLTSDAARRIGLQFAEAQQDGEDTVVPYAALIYDGEGEPWVYQATTDLTFVRESVDVERVEDDRAWLSEGLRPGLGWSRSGRRSSTAPS